MHFDLSKKVVDLQARLSDFMSEEIYPNEHIFDEQLEQGADRWALPPIMETLKEKARSANLWNLFLPKSHHAEGLTNLEYAPLCEIMGRSPIAPEVFNCSAPDTGNMEVIERFGTDAQKEEWLTPLLNGEIRSAYAMSEPNIASSDATNIAMRCVLEDGKWVMNGEKTYISGAGDKRCKILICMVNTNPENSRHQQHSQILVPMNTPGVEIIRPMGVFSMDDAPHGHMHIRFTDVRVPEDNIILGPGRGFEVAQGRLGPGRIHHCMRAIGMAEEALEHMCRRSLSRTAFGKPIAKLGGNYDRIAEARMAIDMARLLTLRSAYAIDTQGVPEAQLWISKIKAHVPNVALDVIDDAIQMHGAAGLSDDFPLARMYMHARTLRLADGPDEVHRMVVARHELRQYQG